MDEIVMNWLTQAPLAVVVLIVAWRIASQITSREQKREADAAALEQQRVAAAQAAQEAGDRQFDKMLELQANQQALHAKTNEALTITSTSLQQLHRQAQEHFAETRAYMLPVAEDVPVIKADVQALTLSVQRLETGNVAILAAVRELSERPNVTSEAVMALTTEVQALRLQTERLAALIPTESRTIEG